MIRQLALFLMNWLTRWATPQQDEMVLALILNTSSLQLTKGEFVQFAPIKGCCGPFHLSGAALPVFQYCVFEKSMMEFICVRVEISKPARIEYYATIDSALTSDPKRHGESVFVKEKYKEPFQKLSWFLFQYFPFVTKQQKMGRL